MVSAGLLGGCQSVDGMALRAEQGKQLHDLWARQLVGRVLQRHAAQAVWAEVELGKKPFAPARRQVVQRRSAWLRVMQIARQCRS